MECFYNYHHSEMSSETTPSNPVGSTAATTAPVGQRATRLAKQAADLAAYAALSPEGKTAADAEVAARKAAISLHAVDVTTLSPPRVKKEPGVAVGICCGG